MPFLRIPCLRWGKGDGSFRYEDSALSAPLREANLRHSGRDGARPSPEPAKDGKWMLTKTASDGNLYRLVILPESSGGFSFHTFYKEKTVK